MTGPSAPPEEKLAIQMPMAFCRSWECGKRVVIIDRVEGARVAAASPMKARAAIIMGALSDRAAISEAVPKAKAPHSRSRRRPIRSPNTPIGISAAARTKP